VNRINIIRRPVGGLEVDTKILAEVLRRLELAVSISRQGNRSHRAQMQRWWRGRLCHAGAVKQVNLFIEDICPAWLNYGDLNVLIPNQEWCRAGTYGLLDKLDFVLCKTRYAEEIFNRLGCRTLYVGFTSSDRYDSAITKDFGQCLHVAGHSLQKGTGTLAKIWAEHPEWPSLTIVTRNPELTLGIRANNISLRADVSDEELTLLQNRCGVHICPSEAEGFGHYICEAMGCAAVVVTTDAPPMNELVSSERGILVLAGGKKPQSLGYNYYVDEQALESSIERVLKMPDREKVVLGGAARNWFLSEKAAFAERMGRAVETIFSCHE